MESAGIIDKEGKITQDDALVQWFAKLDPKDKPWVISDLLSNMISPDKIKISTNSDKITLDSREKSSPESIRNAFDAHTMVGDFLQSIGMTDMMPSFGKDTRALAEKHIDSLSHGQDMISEMKKQYLS